jgi:heme exporter protein D
MTLIHLTYLLLIYNPSKTMEYSNWLLYQIMVLFISYLVVNSIVLIASIYKGVKNCRKREKVQNNNVE